MQSKAMVSTSFSTIFFTLNKLFPVPGMGEYDEMDHYGTLTADECAKWGIIPSERVPVVINGDDSSATQIQETFEKKG